VAAAALAVTVVWFWMALTVHYNYQGNWTALFCIGDRMPAPPELARAEHLYVFPNSSGYDGQFYHDVAHDPGLTHGYERYIDAPRLRQRRILVPALAWILAFGRQQWIDTSYFAMMLGFLALGVYWMGRYCLKVGRSEWWGLLYLAVPSTVISIDRMTTDLALTTLFSGLAYYLRSGSLATLWSIAAAACLIRETGLCIVAGYTVYLLWRHQYRGGALFATSALPFFAWAFLNSHTPSGTQASYPFHFPGSAIVEAFTHPQSYPVPPSVQTSLTIFDLTALAAFLAVLVAACRMAWRNPALGSITVPFVAVVLVLGSLSGMQPEFAQVYAYGRPFSPILLAVVLDALAKRNSPPMVLFGVVSARSALLVGWQAIGVLRAILR